MKILSDVIGPPIEPLVFGRSSPRCQTGAVNSPRPLCFEMASYLEITIEQPREQPDEGRENAGVEIDLVGEAATAGSLGCDPQPVIPTADQTAVAVGQYGHRVFVDFGDSDRIGTEWQ
jgi:hypothetical protein